MTLTEQVKNKLEESLSKAEIEAHTYEYEIIRHVLIQQITVICTLESMWQDREKCSHINMNDEYTVTMDILEEIWSNKDFVHQIVTEAKLLNRRTNNHKIFWTYQLKELYKKTSES